MIEQIASYIIILTIAMVVINLATGIFNAVKNGLSENYTLIMRKMGAIKSAKDKEREERKKTLKYFILFEFFLENCKPEEEEKLKKEYYSIIQEKLREKYEKDGLRSYYLNKLFFECVNFSIVDRLISDLINVYEHFKNLNSKRSIKTNIKFAIIAKDKMVSFKYAQKVLLGINATNSVNQVVSNDEFYNQYQKEKLFLFDFQPKGLVNLVDSDENIEIYRLVKRTK